jgi:hypothetical protein
MDFEPSTNDRSVYAVLVARHPTALGGADVQAELSRIRPVAPRAAYHSLYRLREAGLVRLTDRRRWELAVDPMTTAFNSRSGLRQRIITDHVDDLPPDLRP